MSHIHWVPRQNKLGTPKEKRRGQQTRSRSTFFFQLNVCYESRKREVKIRLMNEGRCDERLKGRVEESTSRMSYHTCGCVVNSPHNHMCGARAVNVRLELVPRMSHRTCGCAVN
jgi:hypothetical protein